MIAAKKNGRMLKRVTDKSPASSSITQTDKSQATLSPLIVTKHKKRKPPPEEITPQSQRHFEILQAYDLTRNVNGYVSLISMNNNSHHRNQNLSFNGAVKVKPKRSS